MHFTYVLFSFKDNGLYIGSTSNIQNRIKRHETGEVISTKYRRPLKLIFYEVFLTSKEAKSREVYLKSGGGRQNLYKMLRVTLSSLGFKSDSSRS